jgi:homeobox protein cut-like
MDEMIQDKVSQKQNELNATYDEKLRNYEERWASVFLFVVLSFTLGFASEQDLQRQVSLAKSQLRDMRMSNDSHQAKLLNHSQRQGIFQSRVLYLLFLIVCNRSGGNC